MSDGPLLIVKTHAFGDAMLCIPAARELLRGLRGQREAWVLAGPSSAPVWERLEGVSRVFTAPFPPAGITGLLRFEAWSVAHIATLHKVSSTVVFHVLPSVRKWVRMLTGGSSRSCGVSPLGSWERVFPMAEGEFAGRSYARAAGVDPADWKVSFPVTPREEEWARSLGIPAGSVAIAPGGGRNPRDDVPEKRWPPDRFADAARRLSREGRGIVLIGGPWDIEASAIVSASVGGGVLDLTGRTDWGRTAAALGRCSAFIGADSGTAHLAAAVGIPSIVLFGPTAPQGLYAEGTVVPVTGGEVCSPCYSSSVFPGCARDRAVCMDSIRVEMVMDALRKVLDENHGC